MKVYILNQEWFNCSEGRDSIIIGVYDSLEKAQSKLKECYDEDIRWLTKDHGFELEEFEENTLDEWSSFVQSNEDYWSYNEILSYEIE